jgi:hypothetical protein
MLNLTLKTKIDMENTGLFNAEGKALSIADVRHSAITYSQFQDALCSTCLFAVSTSTD